MASSTGSVAKPGEEPTPEHLLVTMAHIQKMMDYAAAVFQFKRDRFDSTTLVDFKMELDGIMMVIDGMLQRFRIESDEGRNDGGDEGRGGGGDGGADGGGGDGGADGGGGDEGADGGGGGGDGGGGGRDAEVADLFHHLLMKIQDPEYTVDYISHKDDFYRVHPCVLMGPHPPGLFFTFVPSDRTIVRTQPGGKWKADGRDKQVVEGIGYIRTLKFYSGNKKKLSLTSWKLEEFHAYSDSQWILCKVFKAVDTHDDKGQSDNGEGQVRVGEGQFHGEGKLGHGLSDEGDPQGTAAAAEEFFRLLRGES